MLFETKRLIIRRFTIEDAPAVFEFSSNKQVIEPTGDKLLSKIKEAEDIINNIWLPEYDQYGYARMAIIHKKDKKLIGFAGLKYEPEWKATDIGYRFLPQYWKKGIATEAALPFLFYGFKVLNLPKIVGAAFPSNIGSCKVLEKIGLIYKKETKVFEEEHLVRWYELSQEEYFGMM